MKPREMTKEEAREMEVRHLREAAARYDVQRKLRAERVRAAYRRARAACDGGEAWGNQK